MAPLRLSFACWDYDRMRALQDGRVRPEGVELTYLPLTVEETFYRQARHREFDVSEFSLSSYLLTLGETEPPFVALPVFPSRSFRHQTMYVNGVDRPEDLAGKRIGAPEYQLTACVWQRGLLADEYGVPVDGVQHLTGALEAGGGARKEKLAIDLPSHIALEPIPVGDSLSAMLADGRLDAVIGPRRPSSVGSAPGVRPLFEDFKAAEQDYFRRTRIFPIMHVIVLRRSLYERRPWLARSLTKAFEESLRIAYDDLTHRNALKVMLPWLHEHVAETVSVLGEGYWDYGLEPNRHVLATFARYSFEQGLAKRVYAPEEIVLPEASDSFTL
ncbi:substrate-binding domain-containing protein [Flindersiella endophytica]